MDAAPGILIIVSGLAALVRQVQAAIAARRGGQWTRAQLRPFVFAAMGKVGAALIGVELLAGLVRLSWATADIGAVGALLILPAFVNGVLTSTGEFVRRQAASHRWVAATVAWIKLLLLTVVGQWSGIVIALLLVALLLGPADQADRPRSSTLSPGVAAIGLVWPLTGLLLGVMQWVVLRGFRAGAGRWILATLLGYAVAGIVESGVLAAAGFWPDTRGAPLALMFAVRMLRGVVIALPQWVVLRSWAAASAWWVPGTSAAHVAAYAVRHAFFPANAADDLAQDMLGHLVYSSITAAITCALLVWLLMAQKPVGPDTGALRP